MVVAGIDIHSVSIVQSQGVESISRCWGTYRLDDIIMEFCHNYRTLTGHWTYIRIRIFYPHSTLYFPWVYYLSLNKSNLEWDFSPVWELVYRWQITNCKSIVLRDYAFVGIGSSGALSEIEVRECRPGAVISSNYVSAPVIPFPLPWLFPAAPKSRRGPCRFTCTD